MLLAAGLGTRLAPFTNSHPKALAPVGGKTLLERNVRYLQSAGIHDVVINVHHFADQIEAAIAANDGWGSNIVVSDERGAVLETGGGLKHAARHFDSEAEFVVMNVDILSDLDLSSLIEAQRGSSALATLAVMHRSSSRYLLFDGERRLQGWRNEKTGEIRGGGGEPLAFSGIQVISGSLLKGIQREGKFSLIDVYLDTIAAGGDIRGFDHSGGKLLDVGKPEAIELAVTMFT